MDFRPKVGVGIIVLKDNKILLGKRKSPHGFGFWSPPGGHLEFGESFEVCARRELLEETGLEVQDITQVGVTNDIFINDEKHYVTISLLAKYDQGQPQVLEPDKCEGWDWFAIDNLPSPLFLPFANLLKQGFEINLKRSF